MSTCGVVWCGGKSEYACGAIGGGVGTWCWPHSHAINPTIEKMTWCTKFAKNKFNCECNS